MTVTAPPIDGHNQPWHNSAGGLTASSQSINPPLSPLLSPEMS